RTPATCIRGRRHGRHDVLRPAEREPHDLLGPFVADDVDTAIDLCRRNECATRRAVLEEVVLPDERHCGRRIEHERHRAAIALYGLWRGSELPVLSSQAERYLVRALEVLEVRESIAVRVRHRERDLAGERDGRRPVAALAEFADRAIEQCAAEIETSAHAAEEHRAGLDAELR